MALWLQYTLIALVAAVCVVVVWRSQFPASWRRMLGAFALWAVREGHPEALQRFGRRVAPKGRVAGTCGGCDTDDACH